MTPLLEARAFRIWQFASPLDWCVSYAEIAKATGLTVAAVNDTMFAKSWRLNEGFTNARRGKSIRKHHLSMGYDVDTNEMELTDIFT